VGKNPTAEDFDSHKMIEKRHVDMSALTSPSGRNFISETYRHISQWGKSQRREILLLPPSWGYPIYGVCKWMLYYGVILSLPLRGISYLRGV